MVNVPQILMFVHPINLSITVSQPSAGVGNTGTFFIPSLSNGFSVFVGKPPCFL